MPIFQFLMESVPTAQWHNEVEVSGGVRDVGQKYVSANYGSWRKCYLDDWFKTPQTNMGRWSFTTKYVQQIDESNGLGGVCDKHRAAKQGSASIVPCSMSVLQLSVSRNPRSMWEHNWICVSSIECILQRNVRNIIEISNLFKINYVHQILQWVMMNCWVSWCHQNCSNASRPSWKGCFKCWCGIRTAHCPNYFHVMDSRMSKQEMNRWDEKNGLLMML